MRPKIALPDLSALTVSVDPIEVSDDDVEAELQSLRVRFGSLTEVDRPVALGDLVTIDLSATVDGEDVPNARAEGMSHEVGSGRLIAGLDDALVGLSIDESRVFTAQLATGEHAGQDAQVTATVRSIKERELPEPDDEFAQLASEFDTIDELRANLGDQVRLVKRAQQAEQIQRRRDGRFARAGRRAVAGGDRAGPVRGRRAERAAAASTTMKPGSPRC